MAQAVAGFAGGLGIGIGYGVLSEAARYGLLWAKWKALKGMSYSTVASVMQDLIGAEKDEVTGLSTKGQIDTIIDFIDKTLDFAKYTDEAIATQMFIQMIQQSIAYAIHSSHAGSIGTTGNVYAGSMYLGGAEASSIGSFADFANRHMRAFLGAEVGQNIPTTAFNLIRGGNVRVEEMYRTVLRDIDTLLNEWNDLALSYYRHYHSMARTRFEDSIEMKETATERAYSLLEQVANEHMARISEQLDTLEGAKAWWDAGLVSDDELRDIAIRTNLERDASEDNYDDYKTDIIGAITSAIATWDAKITQAINDLHSNEFAYSLLIKNIFDTLFNDVTTFTESLVGFLDDTVSDVCAYRNTGKWISVQQSVIGIYPELYLLEVDVFNMLGYE